MDAELDEWCSHPYPVRKGYRQSQAVRMVGCEHTHGCPACGFGQGTLPDPCNPEPAYKLVSIR